MNGQIQLYEMIASGKPADETLTALVLFIESQAPEMICTILLLDEDGRMWTGAAPSFPPGLSAAINGSSIGPKAGSCGTAAYRGANVFVEDIETDPLWVDYKHVFLLHDLRACWSSPIFDEQHRVLGTFAMYYREPALPSKHHLDLILVATHIAGLCIMRKRTNEILERNTQQLGLIYNTIPDGLFLLEVRPGFRFRFVSANKAFYKANGLSAEQVIGSEIERVFPASMHQTVLDKFRQAIDEKQPAAWDQAKTSSADETTRITIHPVFNEEGECTHLVGEMRRNRRFSDDEVS